MQTLHTHPSAKNNTLPLLKLPQENIDIIRRRKQQRKKTLTVEEFSMSLDVLLKNEHKKYNNSSYHLAVLK